MSDVDDAKHWRERAAKMRELARTMTDTGPAVLMNDLAADYDKMARARMALPRSSSALRLPRR